MSEDWLGCRVSLDCGTLGYFQGDICRINLQDQTITVRNSFQNGLPCKYPEITLDATNIKDLSILASKEEVEAEQAKSSSSVVHLQKKKQSREAGGGQAKRAGSAQSSSVPREEVQVAKPVPLMSLMSLNPSRKSPAYTHARQSPKKAFDENHCRSRNIMDGGGSRTPNRMERIRMKDEDCFGPNVNEMVEDFDFEQNLALFDKMSVFTEIDQELANKPDVVRLVDCNKRVPEPKYKNDENVLGNVVAEYRQIKTGEVAAAEFVTDSGLVVPALSSPLRERLLIAVDSHGLGLEKQAELMGRAATELALQLLGGQHRLSVTNTHQLPLAVVLCGTSQPGTMGLSAARQLASHGVRTQVYLPEAVHYPHKLETELRLYRLTGGKVVSRAKDLPKTAVDIIITALEDQEMWSQDRCQPWHRSVVAWAAALKAPVLAIDPPPQDPPIPTRMTLVSVLPLDHPSSAGKLYLVNLGIPNNIFKEVGIKYASPFGAKFVIPLHPR